MKNKVDFIRELALLINKYSMENDSNTPDFILAEHLYDCLMNFNFRVKRRDKWYGVVLSPNEKKFTGKSMSIEDRYICLITKDQDFKID